MWREATLDDIKFVSSNVRDADLEEALDMWNVTPYLVLTSTDITTKPYKTLAICDKQGTAWGLAGVAPTASTSTGLAWAVFRRGSDELRFTLMKQARPVLHELHKDYPLLFNWVSAENPLHVNFLRHMGFSFLSIKPTWGAAGKTFYEFASIRKD